MKRAFFATGLAAIITGMFGAGAFAVSGDSATITGGATWDVCVANNGTYTGSSYAVNIFGAGYETQLTYDDFMTEACKSVALPAGSFAAKAVKQSGASAFAYTIDGNKLTFSANVSNAQYLNNYGSFKERVAATVLEVSFNANGGTGTMAAVTAAVADGSVTLPASTLARTDYVFDGWNTKADGTGTDYADGATISFTEGGELELFAKWNPSVATLASGDTFHNKLKTMVGADMSIYARDDSIRAIKKSNALPNDFDKNDEANIVSAQDSLLPVYAWFDDSDEDEDGEGDGVIYYYSEADRIKTNTSMNNMFRGFSSLFNIDDISEWDTSQARSLFYIFCDSALTNVDALEKWDTSNVTDMRGVFIYNHQLSDISGIGKWNTSRVTNMSQFFNYNDLLSDISPIATTQRDGYESWNVSNVENFSSMFTGVSLLDISPLASWDISSAKSLAGMFWQVSGLTNLDALGNWDTSNVENMYGVFAFDSNLYDIGGIEKWNTSKVNNLSYFFHFASNISDISSLTTTQRDGYKSWDVSNVDNFACMFGHDGLLSDIAPLQSWNVENATNMGAMFAYDSSITSLAPLANWNVSNVESFYEMFRGVSAVDDLSDIEKWNTSSAKNVAYMFSGTSIASIDALETTQRNGYKSWDMSNVEDISGMLAYNSSLTDISAMSSWDVSNVTSMATLFANDTSLSDISPISGWDTSSVNNMSAMFQKTLNISNFEAIKTTQRDGYKSWDVSNVTNMKNMFWNDNRLTDLSPLSDWDVSNVTNMEEMFRYCNSLRDLSPIFGWTINSANSMTSMFDTTPATTYPSWYHE